MLDVLSIINFNVMYISCIMRRYTNIALPDDLAEQINQVMKKSNMGYKSKSEFVKEAVRILLRDLAHYQDLKKSQNKKKS